MIIGVGCDCIEIARIRQTVERNGNKFLQRILTVNEIAYCHKNTDPIFAIAGRFAGKESLAKALGVGIGSLVSWHDIEIVNNAAGRPEVVWHIDVRNQFGVAASHLSLSHSHTIAIAYALLEGV